MSGRSLFVSAFFTSLLAACTPSPDDRLKDLEELAAKSPEKAVEEVDRELHILRRENTTTLSAQTVPRILKSSLDGSTAAWLENGSLWVSSPAGPNFSVFVDERASFFQISPDGRHALASKAEGSSCRAVAVSLEKKQAKPLDIQFDCADSPALTASGQLLVVPEKGGLTILELQTGKTKGRIGPENFPRKFPRVPARFVVSEQMDGSIFVFHGAAGAYRMYQIPPGQMQLRLIADSVARPALHGPGKSDTKNIGYVYTGTAGRYLLRPVAGNPPALQEGKKVPASPHTAVDDAGRTIVLENSQFHYVDNEGKLIPLPVRAKSFILTVKGIYYEDLKGHLYLRPAEFTAFEAKLVEIRSRAESGSNRKSEE